MSSVIDKKQQQIWFNEWLSKEYNSVKSKFRQFCFLNGLTYSDDTLNDTVVKVTEKILRDGLKAKTPKEIEDYFFMAFKINTFQAFQKSNQKKYDDTVNLSDLNIIDNDPQDDEDVYQFNDFLKSFFEIKIKERFDNITYSLWRLRYLVLVDGKHLNYKHIKQITKVQDTRKRIVEVNRYIRKTYTIAELSKIFNNPQLRKESVGW